MELKWRREDSGTREFILFRREGAVLSQVSEARPGAPMFVLGHDEMKLRWLETVKCECSARGTGVPLKVVKSNCGSFDCGRRGDLRSG